MMATVSSSWEADTADDLWPFDDLLDSAFDTELSQGGTPEAESCVQTTPDDGAGMTLQEATERMEDDALHSGQQQHHEQPPHDAELGDRRSLTNTSHNNVDLLNTVRACLAKYIGKTYNVVDKCHRNIDLIDFSIVETPQQHNDFLTYEKTMETLPMGNSFRVGDLRGHCYIRHKKTKSSRTPQSEQSVHHLNPLSELYLVDQTSVIEEGCLVKSGTGWKPSNAEFKIAIWRFWLVSAEKAAKIRNSIEQKNRKKATNSGSKLTAKDLGLRLQPCLCVALPKSPPNEAVRKAAKRKTPETEDDIANNIFMVLQGEGFPQESQHSDSESARDLKKQIRKGLKRLIDDLKKQDHHQNRWPDFVFEKGFIVPCIHKILDQAMEDGHLPGVVSESRVKQGDFNAFREIKSLLKYVEIFLFWFKAHEEKIQQLQAALDRSTKEGRDPDLDSLADIVVSDSTDCRPDMEPPAEVWGAKFRFPPRPYQTEAIERCRLHNTIVCLDTGTGKTLIATRAIDHFLEIEPNKKALFLVPTTALVKQQATVVRRNSQELEIREEFAELFFTSGVAELCGAEMDGWTEASWKHCLERNRVLVGTPAIFEKAFIASGFLDVRDFSVVVFDECHNAVGNSPMAVIMRNAVSRVPPADRPRIIGLTASFASGSVTDANVVKKRQALCELLQANMLAPDVPNEQDRELTAVQWEMPALTKQQVSMIAQDLVHPLLEAVTPVKRVRDPAKVERSAGHVLEQLGVEGVRHYLTQGLVVEAEAVAKTFVALGGSRETSGQALLDRLSALQGELEHRFQLLLDEEAGVPTEPWTHKAGRLVEIVKQNQREGVQGIVFCAQNCMVHPLKYLLEQNDVRAGAVAGVSHMTKVRKDSVIKQFRMKAIDVLISTNAAEEGLDVPNCQFVIRFDRFDTTKSHIQGSGRARMEGARIFYFSNDPEVEQQREQLVKEVAKDASLHLAEERLAADSSKWTIPGKYPYPPPPSERGVGTVDFSNCLAVFVDYCVQALRQNVSLEELLQYEEGGPDGASRRLQTCRFPTPKGWTDVDKDRVDEFWGDARLDELLSGKKDRAQEIRFVFVVVIELRKSGHLDDHNQASGAVVQGCKDKCRLPAFESCTNLRPKFDQSKPLPRAAAWEGEDYRTKLTVLCRDRYKTDKIIQYSKRAVGTGWICDVFITIPSLSGTRSADDADDILHSQGSKAFRSVKDAEQAVAKDAWEDLSSRKQEDANSLAGSETPQQDFKGELSRWGQKLYKRDDIFTYRTTSDAASLFVSVVAAALPDSPERVREFRGGSASRRKDAEQAAARVALEHLLDQAAATPTTEGSSTAGSPAASSRSTPMSPEDQAIAGQDFKSMLNQEQKVLGHASYQTRTESGLFVSTVVFDKSEQQFAGEPCGKKKEAEQSAAKAAWQHRAAELNRSSCE